MVRLLMSAMVDHRDLARSFTRFGLGVRGDDGCHARFADGTLAYHPVMPRVATTFRRSRAYAVRDHVLRRPVGTSDGVFVFVALELGGIDAARFEADTNLNPRCPGFSIHKSMKLIFASRPIEQIAAGPTCAEITRASRSDDGDDLFGVTVDQRHLARIAQGRRNRLSRLNALSFFVGRLSGGTMTSIVAFISGMPNSGGVGGSCCT